MGEWVSDRLVGWVGGWGMGGVQVSTWVKKKNIIWYIQWVLEKKIKSDMILCFFLWRHCFYSHATTSEKHRQEPAF